MSGWIKLHRSVKNNWVWEDKPFSKGQAWIDILMMVNHETKKTPFASEIKTVQPGERITSIRQLCERWGWSNTKVKSFLELLKDDEMLHYESDTKKTLLKVLNYSVYQETNPNRNDTKTSQKHIKNDTNQSQKHTNKNDKELKNEKKKDIPPISPTDEKVHFAEYVSMTNAEYETLVSTHGKYFADQCIKVLDNYKGANGKKYKSDYRAILNWVVKRVQEEQTNTSKSSKSQNKKQEIGRVKHDTKMFPWLYNDYGEGR